MDVRSRLGGITLIGLMPLMAGGQTAAPVAGGERLETEYARELSRLRQIELMKAQQDQAAGTANESLWKAQLLLTQYEELTKDKANVGRVTQDYLTALRAYLASSPKELDGLWALEHAKFILSTISQPLLTRMEYFANNRRDRVVLAPLAGLADQLLQAGNENLALRLKDLEAAKPFDEKAYGQRFTAAAEVRYYGAWALYFRAMALEPSDAAARKKLLTQAVESLTEWAVEDSDNGVNYQAYLLRGKVYNESGELAKALIDFGKAQSDKAPAWVQYQARYQSVVAMLAAGELRQAQTSLDGFRRWIPKDNPEAMVSGDMLAYRVAWAVAQSRADATEKKYGERVAMDILSGVIQKDARFRDLVFEQLAAQIPDSVDLRTLGTLQLLAVARSISQDENGLTLESRQRLERAVAAANTVYGNEAASRVDRLEGVFLLGITSALLKNYADAVRFNVLFAQQMPMDPRARQVVDLALQQIGELRRAAAEAGTPLPAEIRDLTARALEISIHTFGQKQWLYAQGRMLEEAGQGDQAGAIYATIPAEDGNFLDARYRLVTLAADRFSKFTAAAGTPEAVEKEAAAALFEACSKFIELLDHPPASAPREVLAAAQAGGYRYNIWFIETAAALHPAVKNTEVALDRVGKLGAARKQLTAEQQVSLLKYQIFAYQLAGQSAKAMQVISEYLAAAGENSAEALGILRGMVLSTINEIDRVEVTDVAQARLLAGNVVQLLEPIIKETGRVTGGGEAAAAKKDEVFEYRLIQADMMVRAGQFKESQALALELQKEKEADIRPYMTEARAIFGQAQSGNDTKEYARAQDYFTRILARMSPGAEGFWESWLRILQATEGQNAGTVEIKKRLGVLKAVYGDKFGGTKYKEDFARMAGRFGV